MKREILFRGKRIDNKGWVYGCLVDNVFFKANTNIAIPYIFNPEHCDSADCFEDFTDDFGYYEVLHETVGQYTGLKDKNGVKIFENDILRVYSLDGDSFDDLEVFFYKGYFALKNKYDKPMYYADESFEVLTEFIFNSYEVIGNIHDNEK